VPGYLDRLNAEFDTITDGVNTILERAAEADRDVTDEEQAQIDRDDTRRQELTRSIEHYTEVEERTGRVAVLRGRVPQTPRQTATTRVTEPEYDIAREFPTPAHWAIAVHRAMTMRDPDATAAIERATAHQMTTDNPGLIPRQILGPVVNMLPTVRPFISSITNRPLAAGKFDRPKVTQHVTVGKQAVEKDLTASQKMVIGNLPVTAATYAGHLNISRQDVKWTSPSILQIVFDDFAAIYADQTDADACTQFAASVTATQAAGDTYSSLLSALYTAAAGMYGGNNGLPDTLWVAPNVWGVLGSMTVVATGSAAFPSLTIGSTSGNPLGLRLVVDPHFAADTAIIGASRFAEWYEDVDGLLQVQEPDVLGQLVGYAGYGAFLNVNPASFSKVTGIGPLTLEAAGAGGGGGGTSQTARR
jgi:HK97 family phage major capsid protein